tara:strand:+ start:1549 stop:1929 length:381 start_codon:yes stop_codon:yes gene_type:complete
VVISTKLVDNMEFPLSQRIAAMFFGLFLFCFGIPFTLTPFVIFGDEGPGMHGIEILFLCGFTIPFLLAGLFVQYMGAKSFIVGFTGKVNQNQSIFHDFENRVERDIDIFDPPEPGEEAWWKDENES